MKVISVRQPWAYAIIHMGKDIENRKWATKYRGPLLIHASMTIDKNAPQEIWDEFDKNCDEKPVFGGIIGMVNIVDVVEKSESKWKQEFSKGWVLENPKPLPYFRCQGRVGIFDPPEDFNAANT